MYTESGCKNKFLNNVCSNIKGECINLSLVTCKNDDTNNLTLNSEKKLTNNKRTKSNKKKKE